MQPATIVEDTGFQSLVCLLDSWYQLSSRRHIMRSLLPDMYTTRAKEIKRELLQISHVALTSDLWTSRTTKSYLTITCYFVTSTWELKSLVLETFGFKNDHTAENIAASFQKIAEEWGISREVVAMVTDNAANVVAAVRHTGWTHVPCFAHTLNLVVSEEIKADTKIYQLRKSLWAFSTTALRPQKSWRRYNCSWEFLRTNSSNKWKPDGTHLTTCLNASRSNIKLLPQHFVSLVVMQCVFHLLMWACWKLPWPFWNPLRQRPKRFLQTSMSPFLRWYLWRTHDSVWLVRLQKRTHPWFPTLVTRWDATSQISKALACWRCRPYWIPGWRNWRSVTRQPWDRQSSGLFRRCQGMSRLMIPMKIGSPVIQLKQLACGISSTQWSSNQHHKEPQPVMQHWKLGSILKNQCWQDSKIPYCGGRRMSDTMNLSQKLRRSIFASLVHLFPPKGCSLK